MNNKFYNFLIRPDQIHRISAKCAEFVNPGERCGPLFLHEMHRELLCLCRGGCRGVAKAGVLCLMVISMYYAVFVFCARCTS
jgi:hypothetical protein